MSDKTGSFRFLDVDVSDKVSELQVGRSKKINFLEWAKVLILLHEQGVNNVQFGVTDNTDGYPAFYDVNGNNPFIKVWVALDDEKFEITYPVIANQGDTFKVVERPSQLDMEFSKARAFVKCVAINTGLGLKLWLAEEQQMAQIEDEASMDNKQLTEELEESMLKVVMNLKDRGKALELLGTSPDQFDDFCNRDDLIAFEQKMGWYKTLKVAIHNFNSLETKEENPQPPAGDSSPQAAPASDNSAAIEGDLDAFKVFIDEKGLVTYDDFYDFMVTAKPTAGDLKMWCARLKIEYSGKLKSRDAIVKMWELLKTD